MRRALALAVIAALAGGCGAAPSDPVPAAEAASATPAQAVTLKAADGVTVHGVHYAAAKPKALILLFHQAMSSKDEYATIAPRLAEAGYSALAIDQRSGGRLFGPNQTVAGIGHNSDYLDARPDMEAALAWATDKRLPVILWGSSYSSSLVFLIAADRPDDVAALFAFSPGEYFDDKELVRRAAAKVRAPIFVTSAKDAGEIAEAKAIYDAAPAVDKIRFEPKIAGVHGSSTLIAARDPQGADENWSVVLAFLRRVAP